eukprot:gene1715-3320_t
MGTSSCMISQHLYGTLLVASGELVISLDALSLRLVNNLPDDTVNLFKFLIYAITSMLMFLTINSKTIPSKIASFGRCGLVGSLIWGGLNFTITYAIQYTSAANALVIFSSGPMFASLLSYIILKEVIPLRTIIAIITCLSGVILIFSTALSSNQNDIRNTIGIICAILAAIFQGLFFVYMKYIESKYNADPDVFILNALSGVVVVIGLPVSISLYDILFLCLGGAVILPLSLNLLIGGSKFISPPETTMFMLLEVAFGPLWVWLAGFESPPEYTVYGGAIVILSLLIHSILALRATNTPDQHSLIHNQPSSSNITDCKTEKLDACNISFEL